MYHTCFAIFIGNRARASTSYPLTHSASCGSARSSFLSAGPKVHQQRRQNFPTGRLNRLVGAWVPCSHICSPICPSVCVNVCVCLSLCLSACWLPACASVSRSLIMPACLALWLSNLLPPRIQLECEALGLTLQLGANGTAIARNRIAVCRCKTHSLRPFAPLLKRPLTPSCFFLMRCILPSYSLRISWLRILSISRRITFTNVSSSGVV